MNITTKKINTGRMVKRKKSTTPLIILPLMAWLLSLMMITHLISTAYSKATNMMQVKASLTLTRRRKLTIFLLQVRPSEVSSEATLASKSTRPCQITRKSIGLNSAMFTMLSLRGPEKTYGVLWRLISAEIRDLFSVRL